MEMFAEMSADDPSAFLAPPPEEQEWRAPAIGPGGLVNVSQLSRTAAEAGLVAEAGLAAEASAAPSRARARREPRVTVLRAAGAGAAPAPAGLAPKRPTDDERAAAAPQPRQATREARRGLSIALILVHVYASRRLGGYSVVVALCGAVALAYALRCHDDDVALGRVRAVASKCAQQGFDFGRRLAAEQSEPVALLARSSLVALRGAAAQADAHCPKVAKHVGCAVLCWRLWRLAFGARRAALCARLAVGVAAGATGHFADGAARAAAYGGAAWATVALLDVAGHDEAGAALLCAAWMTRPQIAGLERRLAPPARQNGDAARPPLVRSRCLAGVVTCRVPAHRARTRTRPAPSKNARASAVEATPASSPHRSRSRRPMRRRRPTATFQTRAATPSTSASSGRGSASPQAATAPSTLTKSTNRPRSSLCTYV
ncbi:hypothetical protein M885DRAFT_514733 [Pelagophyceae sp. CCMP2097]|nr:hypothetical protein M885DRAFT_514733 [Pelagophyceae sp. CCMP2097]